jgi:hypothetical protein
MRARPAPTSSMLPTACRIARRSSRATVGRATCATQRSASASLIAGQLIFAPRILSVRPRVSASTIGRRSATRCWAHPARRTRSVGPTGALRLRTLRGPRAGPAECAHNLARTRFAPMDSGACCWMKKPGACRRVTGSAVEKGTCVNRRLKSACPTAMPGGNVARGINVHRMDCASINGQSSPPSAVPANCIQSVARVGVCSKAVTRERPLAGRGGPVRCRAAQAVHRLLNVRCWPGRPCASPAVSGRPMQRIVGQGISVIPTIMSVCPIVITKGTIAAPIFNAKPRGSACLPGGRAQARGDSCR